MININEELINSVAPNESALKNALGLVKKNSFAGLWISEDETIIFGECIGSGSTNYNCSADFITPENPVFRCTCPSRQIPCKHTLGLMYAYVQRMGFTKHEIPEDIIEKREKAEKRDARKKEVSSSPKKVNKAALEKKIKMQLEGLDLFEKVVKDIVKGGLAAVDGNTLNMLEEQGKTLNSLYLTGGQRILRDISIALKKNESQEVDYTNLLSLLSVAHTLCRKGREHLNKRLLDPELKLDVDSNIDELIGHVWQTSELEELGLFEADAELVQLYFNVYIDEGRKEFVDVGYWINLKNGLIHRTCNYRPFRAAKHIKEEDSFFSVAEIKRLYVYPGDINKRVRFDDISIREIKNEDYKLILSYVNKNYIDVVKKVKNSIKNPLSDKNPVMLLNYKCIGMVDDSYVIEDADGKRIILRDTGVNGETPSIQMLGLLKENELKNGAMLVMFNHSQRDEKLTAQPLSIITPDGITRLVY